MSALNIKKGSSSHSAYDLRASYADTVERHTLAIVVENEPGVLAHDGERMAFDRIGKGGAQVIGRVARRAFLDVEGGHFFLSLLKCSESFCLDYRSSQSQLALSRRSRCRHSRTQA